MTEYANYTYNSSNPLRRFSHRTRFKHSIESIKKKNGINILDFGCGDAMFLNQLKDSSLEEMNLLGFDPILDPIEENVIPFVRKWEDVVEYARQKGPFDYVLCFEVLEHFSPKKQPELIEQMNSVLKDDGTLVVSVPIESGLPSLVKNVLRRRSKTHRKIYSYKNMLLSFRGKPLGSYRNGFEDDYIYQHIGFYFTELESILKEYFHIDKKIYSPFPFLGKQFNSQVFYRLTKRI